MSKVYTRRYNIKDDGTGAHVFASAESRKLCHECLNLLGQRSEKELLLKNIELLEHHHKQCLDAVIKHRMERVMDYLDQKITCPTAKFDARTPARFR